MGKRGLKSIGLLRANISEGRITQMYKILCNCNALDLMMYLIIG